MTLPMPISELTTYRDAGYSAFLQKTEKSFADTRSVPGQIAPTTDLSQTNSDFGKQIEILDATVEDLSIPESISDALIKSANTIVNASNQITQILGNGITVWSGTAVDSGARVVLNSAGIAAYNSGGSATLTIDASDGSITMLGSLTSGSTITGATINIGSGTFQVDVDGNVIAESFATDVSGQDRIEMHDNAIFIYNSSDSQIGKIDSSGVLMISVDTGISAGTYFRIQESTTPSASAGFGKIYTKSDNKLYFQDGGGTEHEIAFV